MYYCGAVLKGASLSTWDKPLKKDTKQDKTYSSIINEKTHSVMEKKKHLGPMQHGEENCLAFILNPLQAKEQIIT